MGEEILLRSLADTERLGRRLAGELGRGGVVWLVGPLGSGKTALAKAVFGALGVDPRLVTSPSFTLVNRYRVAAPGRPALYHADLYRLEGGADLEGLGLEEICDGDAVVLIEWAERLGPRWGEPAWRVTLEEQEDATRRVLLERGLTGSP